MENCWNESMNIRCFQKDIWGLFHEVDGQKSGNGEKRNAHTHDHMCILRNVHVFSILQLQCSPNHRYTCQLKCFRNTQRFFNKSVDVLRNIHTFLRNICSRMHTHSWEMCMLRNTFTFHITLEGEYLLVEVVMKLPPPQKFFYPFSIYSGCC